MAGKLSGKIAVILGASSGMGRSTALAFAAAGAHVVVSARRQRSLEEVRDEIEAAGGKASVATVDVTRRDEVVRLFKETVERLGRIDAVVYASGINVPDRGIDVLSPADWHALIETNLTGAYHCTQAVLPTFLTQGDGLLIYISSVSAKRGDGSGIAYQAAKRGLDGIVAGARQELSGRNVRFSVIYPGLCDTPLVDRRPSPPTPEERAKALQPEDVAEACLYVAATPMRVEVPELVIMPAAPLK